MTAHLDTIRDLLKANRTENDTQHRILTPAQVSALGRVLADDRNTKQETTP